jgi:2-succinyl-5-enolpyruvyl-6-hydroxy-3-cyclohexene-1-carboxylate synthase
VEELALALAGARRPLVLVGALTEVGRGTPSQADPEPRRAAVARLMAVLPLPVWAEATSNLRVVPGVVATADLLLASSGFRSALGSGEGPDGIDLVLHLGEAPVTWPLRSFVGELDRAEHWAIDRWGRRHDPEHRVHRSIAADPARTLDAVAEWLERNPIASGEGAGWAALHRTADRAARRALEAEAGDGPLSGPLFDGGVVPRLARLLPEDAALVVSSSMPLRELEAFFAPPVDPDRRIDVFANRGVNGIDGVTSTAAGIAEGRRVGAEVTGSGSPASSSARSTAPAIRSVSSRRRRFACPRSVRTWISRGGPPPADRAATAASTARSKPGQPPSGSTAW